MSRILIFLNTLYILECLNSRIIETDQIYALKNYKIYSFINISKRLNMYKQNLKIFKVIEIEKDCTPLILNILVVILYYSVLLLFQ